MIRIKPSERKTEIISLTFTRKEKKDMVYFAAKYNVALSFLIREVLKVFISQENEALLNPAQNRSVIQDELFTEEDEK